MSTNVIAGLPSGRAMMHEIPSRRRAPAAGALSLAAMLLATAAFSGSSAAESAKPVLKPIDVFDLQWVADPQGGSFP